METQRPDPALRDVAELQRAVAKRVGERIGQAGPALAQRAFVAGLAVTRSDGVRQPIPIGAVPAVVGDGELERRLQLAAALVAATARAARWRLSGSLRPATLDALSPAERRLVERTGDLPATLAVARVDFIGESLSALEVNATIPAMQAYSDIAAGAWLDTFAPASRAPAWARANGSNTLALLDALLALYRRARSAVPRRIALLARPGDAQRTELEHLARQFAAHGHEAVLAEPAELRFESERLWRLGQPLDLVYRHLFLSRLDADPCVALEAAFSAQGEGTLVLNPPAPHLEMKSTLALLSRATREPALAQAIGLAEEELAAIAAAVPWTRRLDALDADTLAEVCAAPDAYVLKRSWSYGGRDVFVGRARHEADFAGRVAAAFAGVEDWTALVRAAASDRRGDGFVVQRAAVLVRRPQWLCTPAGVQQADVVTDFSAYASLGAEPAWSGVCRAATGDVVNIVGGGGVVPLLRASVAERWLAEGAS